MYIVLCGPTSSGKTFLRNNFLPYKFTNTLYDFCLHRPIGVTTRKPRNDEVHGEDYFFITQKEYDTLLKTKNLEFPGTYGGHSYGTPKTQMEVVANSIPVLILDPLVAMTLQDHEDILVVYVNPTEEAEKYAAKRSRLNQYREDLALKSKFDNIVNNDWECSFYESLNDLKHLVCMWLDDQTDSVGYLFYSY